MLDEVLLGWAAVESVGVFDRRAYVGAAWYCSVFVDEHVETFVAEAGS